MTERLPELLDARHLAAELGVTRAVAEKLMRQLRVVTFEDVRKVYVRRSDVLALIQRRTFSKDEVPGVKAPRREEVSSNPPPRRW